MDPTRRPISPEEWLLHLSVCRDRLRQIHQAGYRVTQDPDSLFYIPQNLKWLISMQVSGEDLLKFIMLIRDLYLSQVCEPDVILGGTLSDLKPEAEIELALTKHLHGVIQTRLLTNAGETVAHQLVQELKKELNYLQESGMAPIPESRQSAQMCRIVCEVYFLTCAVHPDVDLDGNNARWYQSMFQQQPCYIDGDEMGYPGHPGTVTAALLQLFQSGLVTDDDDILKVFEVLGRWILAVTVNLLGPDPAFDYDESEDIFLDYFADDLSNPVSSTPIVLRLELCDINLRHVYRELCWAVADLIRDDRHLATFDVLNHRMWQWTIQSILASNLAPRHKNLVSNWLWKSSFVRAFTSEEPIGAPWPGQGVFSRLSPEANVFTRVITPFEETTESLEDVEFQATGPSLEPLDYAEKLDDSTDWNEDECIICLEDLVDDQQLKVKIDVCGHLSHGDCLSQLINGMDHWSNKCPACRREICPPRQREPVIHHPRPIDGVSDHLENSSADIVALVETFAQALS